MPNFENQVRRYLKNQPKSPIDLFFLEGDQGKNPDQYKKAIRAERANFKDEIFIIQGQKSVSTFLEERYKKAKLKNGKSKSMFGEISYFFKKNQNKHSSNRNVKDLMAEIKGGCHSNVDPKTHQSKLLDLEPINPEEIKPNSVSASDKNLNNEHNPGPSIDKFNIENSKGDSLSSTTNVESNYSFSLNEEEPIEVYKSSTSATASTDTEEEKNFWLNRSWQFYENGIIDKEPEDSKILKDFKKAIALEDSEMLKDSEMLRQSEVDRDLKISEKIERLKNIKKLKESEIVEDNE